MKISDFKGVFKTSLATVKFIDNPFEDYYVIGLQTEPGTTWKAGEHGIFSIPGKAIEGKKSRAFSIASIPSEGTLLLGTRTGKTISNFKKELLSAQAGDKISIRGPFGPFLLQDDKTPVVFLAGGVGITPFRALLKELEHSNTRPVEIVYASRQYYLFGDEIEQIVAGNNQMHLSKTQETEETQAEIAALAKKYQNNAFYYLSGAPKMISSMKKVLKANGVKSGRTISDAFMGY